LTAAAALIPIRGRRKPAANAVSGNGEKPYPLTGTRRGAVRRSAQGRSSACRSFAASQRPAALWKRMRRDNPVDAFQLL